MVSRALPNSQAIIDKHNKHSKLPVLARSSGPQQQNLKRQFDCLGVEVDETFQKLALVFVNKLSTISHFTHEPPDTTKTKPPLNKGKSGGSQDRSYRRFGVTRAPSTSPYSNGHKPGEGAIFVWFVGGVYLAVCFIPFCR